MTLVERGLLVDAALQHLKAQRVKFRSEAPYDTPVCRMISIMDPDDNPILIHQRKHV